MSSCKDIHTVEILDAIRKTVENEVKPSYVSFNHKSYCFNAASAAICVGIRLGVNGSDDFNAIEALAKSILDCPVDSIPETTTKCL